MWTVSAFPSMQQENLWVAKVLAEWECEQEKQQREVLNSNLHIHKPARVEWDQFYRITLTYSVEDLWCHPLVAVAGLLFWNSLWWTMSGCSHHTITGTCDWHVCKPISKSWIILLSEVNNEHNLQTEHFIQHDVKLVNELKLIRKVFTEISMHSKQKHFFLKDFCTKKLFTVREAAPCWLLKAVQV